MSAPDRFGRVLDALLILAMAGLAVWALLAFSLFLLAPFSKVLP